MDTGMRLTAESAARLILQHFQQEHPDWTDDYTPIDDIVAWSGLQVETFHPDDYPEGTYGFMDSDEGENLIWLCRDLPEAFRRFTLAHELGHAILHCQNSRHIHAISDTLAALALRQNAQLPELSREDPCHNTDMQTDMVVLQDQEDLMDVLGIGETYDPRSQRELAANIFAAELLLPLERVRIRYLEEAVSPSDIAVSFGVSHTAVLNRLAGLLKEATTGNSAPLPPLEQKRPEQQTKKRYDEFQQTAIEAPTPALIVAGPGSGKTSTLIGRTEYIIQQLGVQPQQILALTFSRKAALEMEERLRRVLTGPLPKVSTFHAFCADVLRQYGTLVGLRKDFALIDEAEGYFLLRQQANQMRLRHYQKLQAPTYYFPDMLKAISRAKDELISPTAYADLALQMKEEAQDEEEEQKAVQALEVAHVYELYEEGLAQRGDSDFGGLLALTIRLFHEHPAILYEQQQKYQHILVDEFQDVNRASGILLRELAGEKRQVWVVGDANQAIYGFRGASPANISQFEKDFPGATILPLSRNYRSRPELVSLAESFRCHHLEVGEKPGKNQATRSTEVEPYVTIASARDEASELAGIIEDIRYKHTQGYHYKDMIVLCRTRSHAQKITQALAAADLPVIERAGFLQQEHIKDLLSILLLLSDPSGMGLLRAARQPAHPLSQDDIESFLLRAREQNTPPRQLLLSAEIPLTVSVTGYHALNRLAEILHNLQHATDIWSLLAQYLLSETSIIRDLLTMENKQHLALLIDYDNLLQLARHYDQQLQAQGFQLEPASSVQETEATLIQPRLADRIKGFLEYIGLLVLLRQDGINRQGDEEEDEESADIIRVMTTHASKGLEFPVVYLPGLVQRRFPLQARSGPISHPKGMLAPESTGSAAHESGEACLFYVGVTRARNELVLSYSERYGKVKYKPSLYLDALESGLPSERIRHIYWDKGEEKSNEDAEAQVLPSSQPSEQFIATMKQPTLTASAIEAYQRCPRQYAYSSIYHFSSAKDTYQIFWKATHTTVDLLRKQMQESKEGYVPTQEEIQELYTRHWQELGGHDALFAPMYEQHGHEVVEAIRRQLSIEEEMTWDLRPHYPVDVAGRTVHVTVDRVELSNQMSQPVKFVRARFGKSKEKPTPEMREFFYTLAYRQHHPSIPIELESHNLSTGETAPIKMTARKEQSLYESVERSIEGLESNLFPAQPAEAFRCPSCPFFLICPA